MYNERERLYTYTHNGSANISCVQAYTTIIISTPWDMGCRNDKSMCLFLLIVGATWRFGCPCGTKGNATRLLFVYILPMINLQICPSGPDERVGLHGTKLCET